VEPRETETKAMTLRLDKPLADRVQALAEIENLSVAQIVRDAISSHVQRRSQEPDFRTLLKAQVERSARMAEMFESDTVKD
jgi:predicted transcriptional regulator